MYNQPYFIPRYFTSPSMMGMGNVMNRSLGGAMGSAMNGTRLAAQGASKGLGLFSRLGNSMRALRGVNWGGLITNASKTLNVVNQAIPLVRQVGPMVNNMKSMLRVASIFKDETDNNPVQVKSKTTNNSSKNYTYKNVSNGSINTERQTITKDIKEEDYHSFEPNESSPTFFIA